MNICIHSYYCTCPDYKTIVKFYKHIHLTVQFLTMQQARTEKNSTNDDKNLDKDLNYLLEAIMSDDGDLDIIKTRQHIFNKIETIITLVVQCSDKQTINTQLGPTIQLKKC